MKLNEKLLINASKIIILLFAIYLIFQIARASIGWGIVTGSFMFLVAVWLNHEPEQCRCKRERNERIAKSAREQREMIGGEK